MLFCFCCYADISHGQSDFIMTNVNKLPILDTSGIKVGYEGSIDKKVRMRIGIGGFIKRGEKNGLFLM